MTEFRFNPPIETAKPGEVFTQTIYFQDGKIILGKICWIAVPADEGVVQILELWIDPPIRRRGHARRLMAQLLIQARTLQKSRNQKLRRFWIGVGHKTQVVGRSFLTNEGFHHVGSTGGLLQDQDLLIYVKALD